MRIKGFPENAKIIYIGSVFKYNIDKNWYMNLGLKHGSHFGFYYVRFSNSPAVARNRCLNPKDSPFQVKGFFLKFKIDSTSTWVSSCSVKNKQHSFMFYAANIKDTHKTTLIYLPHIELARVLFFHNAYLARSALDSGCLAREFDVQQQSENSALINALPICNYPLRQFDNAGMRRFLAWILLDSDARKSYESIALNEKINGFDTKSSRRWNFCFTPPLLKDVTVEAYGYFNSDLNEFNIYEITAIHDLSANLPKIINFHHPKFTKKVGQGKGGSYSDPTSSNKPPEIDDAGEADLKKPITINVPKVSLSFKLAVETKKVAKRSRKGTSKGNSDEPSEYDSVDDNNVSTGESSSTGTMTGGEFEGIQDESEDLELFLSRFSAFSEMIDQFFMKNNIGGSFEIHKLPYIERCSKYLTDDGNTRCIAEAKFKHDGKCFAILEVDTSDNIQPLSTKVFLLRSFDGWSEYLKRIRFLLVKKSLRWPVIEPDDLILETWQINHPRSDSEIQHMSSVEIEHWADRLGSTILSKNVE